MVSPGYPAKADSPQSAPASIAGRKVREHSAESNRQIMNGKKEKAVMNEVCSACPV
jgi:hypothetical protein